MVVLDDLLGSDTYFDAVDQIEQDWVQDVGEHFQRSPRHFQLSGSWSRTASWRWISMTSEQVGIAGD